MPIVSKEQHYFGYDNLFEAMKPFAFVQAMEVGGCRHERGWLKVDMIVVPTGGFWSLATDPDDPTRAEFAAMRRNLYDQAERGIAVLEVAHFDHLKEPEITISADSYRRLECRVRCEGTMPQ